MEDLVSIGKILNFHGVQGEVKVGYTINKEEQLENISKVYAVKDNKTISLTIEYVKFHKKHAIIKFKEISSIDEAIELKGAYLKVPKEVSKEYLEKDEFYIDDLIGSKVFDTDGNFIGKINGVSPLGQNVLSIEDESGHQSLIPFVKELVPEVDIENGKVVIKKIPGLLKKE